MDTLHNVLRSIRGETKSPRDHLIVFREFIDHLDRATLKRRRSPRPVKRPRGKERSGRR